MKKKGRMDGSYNPSRISSREINSIGRRIGELLVTAAETKLEVS
jgi:hypothetical protein